MNWGVDSFRLSDRGKAGAVQSALAGSCAFQALFGPIFPAGLPGTCRFKPALITEAPGESPSPPQAIIIARATSVSGTPSI